MVATEHPEMSESVETKKEELKSWKEFLLRPYIIFWHELSMDPRVRRSPYHDPPENEVQLTWWDKVYVRGQRSVFLTGHLMWLYTLYLMLSGQVKLYTILWAAFVLFLCRIGVTVAVHRLWSHRSFKATTPLRIFLMICQTMTLELSILTWCRMHRSHHKYTDTDADLVNAKRGFFFSHIGWLLILEHPEVTKKCWTFWVEDLKKEKIVMFQYNYYLLLVAVFAYAIPVTVPWYFWNENIWTSQLVSFLFVTILSRHLTFTVNSVAHIFGSKPYNEHNTSVDTNALISFFQSGEGWHDFHHAFPWDYRIAEVVGYVNNMGALMIDLFAWMGMAYDLKTVSEDLVVKQVKKFGDGSHRLWGWGDTKNTPEQKAVTLVKYLHVE